MSPKVSDKITTEHSDAFPVTLAVMTTGVAVNPRTRYDILRISQPKTLMEEAATRHDHVCLQTHCK